MSCEELSNQFDVLYNSHMNKDSFGETSTPPLREVDEYEKSVLLTQAQMDVVLEIYKGFNGQLGFEKTEEAREYIKPLLHTNVITAQTEVASIGVSDSSKFYTLPTDVLFITMESAVIGTTNSHKKVVVKPITQDEIQYILSNPFKGANDNRVLRIDTTSTNVYAELISIKPIMEYHFTYLKKPTPIVLSNIGTLSIQGISAVTEPLLQHPVVQDLMLRKAVDEALRRSGIQINK